MKNKSTHYTKLNRRGYEIVLPTDVYKDLMENKLNISLVINNTGHSTVQLTKNNKYICTLKSALDVIGFKNGNNLDFHKSNLIYNK